MRTARLALSALAAGLSAAVVLVGCTAQESAAPVESASSAEGQVAARCTAPFPAAVAYDPAKADYAACDVVRLDGKDFVAKYPPLVNACPIQSACAATYDAYAWMTLAEAQEAAARKTEFSYYQEYRSPDGAEGYPALLAQLTDGLRDCTAADYSAKQVTSGTMLACFPRDPVAAPNVRNAMRYVTKKRFAEFAPTLAQGDATYGYPVNPAYTADAYTAFLRSIARFPAMCAQADDECARALAGYFAQASQESGAHGADIDLLRSSFNSLRESGAPGQASHTYNKEGKDCPKTLTCPPGFPPSGQSADPSVNYTGWYYGRGPFQLSYPGNYAYFAKLAFGDDKQQFLLDWPDLVAWDPDLYFLSGMWFYMTPQPPKPSMFDVLTGRYSPKPVCKTAADCHGIIAAPGGGTANPFEATIEIINPIECRPASKQPAPAKRAKIYLEALQIFGSKPAPTESKPTGCDNIRRYSAGFELKTVYSDPNLAY